MTCGVCESSLTCGVCDFWCIYLGCVPEVESKSQSTYEVMCLLNFPNSYTNTYSSLLKRRTNEEVQTVFPSSSTKGRISFICLEYNPISLNLFPSLVSAVSTNEISHQVLEGILADRNSSGNGQHIDSVNSESGSMVEYLCMYKTGLDGTPKAGF